MSPRTRHESSDTELLYGIHPVREALRAGRVPHAVYVAGESKALQGILSLAQRVGAPIQHVSKEEVGNLCRSGHHQNIAAVFPPRPLVAPEQVLALAQERNETPFLLVLDHPQDPQNVGSLIRTAEAVGVHGILLPKDRSVALSSTLARVSAGAIEHVALCQVTNLARTLQELKQQGVWVIGLEAGGNTAYDQLDYQFPLAVVVGSEGEGMQHLVKRTCDYLVRLPMRGMVASLNAAVAGSILLYHVWRVRQRVGETSPLPAH